MLNPLKWVRQALYKKLKPKPKEKVATLWTVKYLRAGSYELTYKEVEVDIYRRTSNSWIATWKEKPYDDRGFERWFIEHRIESTSKSKLILQVIRIIDNRFLENDPS